MNKNFIYAMLSAIALTGAVGFSSCSSSEDLKVEDNPSYNAKTGEVGVDFVMNIATGNTASTRMSSANTQATESEIFRGIENAALMAFSLTGDGKNVATASTANKHYDMGTIMGAEAIDPDGTGSTPKSRRVIELSLPTGTNTLMFWGKAIKTASDTHAGNNQQGAIDWTMNKDFSGISFTLKKRIPVSTTDPAGTTAFGQYESLIADVLTQLLEKKYPCHATYSETDYDENRAWKDYITVDNDGNLVRKAGLSPLGEIIADVFISLNTFKANEVRAGSGPSVAMMLGDLFEVINTVASASPTSSAEAITKAFAGHLKGDLTTLVDASAKKWQTTINSIKGLSGKTAEEQATAYSLVTRDLNDFPRTIFNVPQGATTLKLTITNKENDATRTFKYEYNQTIPTYAMDGTAGGEFDPLNYRYPAELCYFGNSPVRVTDDPHVTTEYPDGTGNWDTDDSWAAGATGTGSKAWTKNGHVLSSTRSVAMQENINYGTALLKTTVRYGAAVLKDNNKAMHENEEDNSITVGAGTFTLTGILIGGVEPTVGWNYIAKSDAPEYKSFIYDPDLPSTAIPTGGTRSEPNYTLVWDNWNVVSHTSNTKQNVVYCALEFVNNSGQNFWGMNNMIRNGATFYISGKLDPDGTIAVAEAADKSKGIDWPLARNDEKVDGKFHYALPPYDGSGNTIKERRVFIQDYMTTADFVIGENSLKSALVEVPDLRSSQISLGLSVDLKWQTGLNFSEITLGE